MITPSPVESHMFYSAGVWEGLWDDQPERRKLRETLDKTPHGQFNWSCELVELYESLNKLLSSGNDRFVLYCPFNIVPEASWYRQCDPSLDAFIELYLESWHRLLSHHDLRANFTDGDIEDTERVVQAAYLVPKLAQRGLLSANQVGKLLENDDEVLVKSLQEAYGCVEPPQKSYDLDIADEKRARWIQWEQHRQSIEFRGKSLATSLIGGFGIPKDTDPEVAIVAIRRAIERLWACGQIEDAKVLYGRYEKDMMSFANVKFFCRLHSIGIVSDAVLDELGIKPPNLAGPFFPHVSVDDCPIVDDAVYPVKILFGSRLKGYGSSLSDYDYAVFVKPEQNRAYVDGLLGPDVFQFWLVEDGDILRIRDHESGSNVGYSSDTHVLFCGAWMGDINAIEMLSNKLLKPLIANRDKELWLWQMERDLLQYRLLHRGYEDFYVTQCPTFLDDGYRMTAAKLYASYVW